jgi:hypothetical protein
MEVIYAGLSTWEVYMQDRANGKSICRIDHMGSLYAGLSTWDEYMQE